MSCRFGQYLYHANSLGNPGGSRNYQRCRVRAIRLQGHSGGIAYLSNRANERTCHSHNETVHGGTAHNGRSACDKRA
jgi:hypothetical protein